MFVYLHLPSAPRAKTITDSFFVVGGDRVYYRVSLVSLFMPYSLPLRASIELPILLWEWVFEIHSGSLVLVSSYHPGLAFSRAAATVQGLSVPEALDLLLFYLTSACNPQRSPLVKGHQSPHTVTAEGQR